MPLQILNHIPRAVLKNQALQSELNREGIITFTFLNTKALTQLRQLYQQLHPQPPQGPIEHFYVSTHSPYTAYKLSVQNGIKKIIEPFCQQHFTNYRLTTSALIVKKPSPQSELGLHQDWNVVDETQYASYGLWVPLVDITSNNGALYALKRSHRLGPTYRHAALPAVFGNITAAAEKYVVPFEIKAGEALLFNQALLHKSAPNLSHELRTTIVNTIVPQQAQHLMYAPAAQPDMVDAYHIPDDTVQHYHSFFEDSVKVPASALKAGPSLTADFTPLEEEEFERLYQQLLHEK